MKFCVFLTFAAALLAEFSSIAVFAEDASSAKKKETAARAKTASGTTSKSAKKVTDKAKATDPTTEEAKRNDRDDGPVKSEVATFGSGCFWCAEAAFERLKGVEAVVSGYSGGKGKDPSYELVSTGLTGHAEVVQITYNPKVITYAELLDVFFKTHDPTKLNEQGPDHGTQYRSVIFYHSEEQKELAEAAKQKLSKSGRTRRIVTEISDFTAFYPAEDYHQNYYRSHPDDPYCQSEVRERLHKVNRGFRTKLKGKSDEQAK